MYKPYSSTVALTLLCLLVPTQQQQCSEEISNKQAQMWQKSYTNNVRWSGCGGKAWLSRYYELSTNDVEILFDIGCNKGYESALMMSLFKPEAGVKAESFYDIHAAEARGLEGKLCGACDNCHEVVNGTRQDAKQQEVHLYCFEPSLRNFEALINARRHVEDKLTEVGLNWHLINAAVGPKVSLVKFPRACGTTFCQVAEDGEASNPDGPQHEAAFMTSVDAFVAAEGLQRIDILKIDTEGHDPAVIFGSKGVLQDKKVSLMYFELNSMGLWKTVQFKEIITALDTLGYECYLEGTPTLTRLTGSCWQDEYEFKDWANVVCANREHFMAAELERLSWQGMGLLDGDL